MADAFARVAVVYSPAPRQVLEWTVRLPPGATVLEALKASGLHDEAPELDPARADVAVWGRKVDLTQHVHEGDRVEVLRQLRVDPKVARRERFRRQGMRAAGLFARRNGEQTPEPKAGLD